jgi:hypothetical protein
MTPQVEQHDGMTSTPRNVSAYDEVLTVAPEAVNEDDTDTTTISFSTAQVIVHAEEGTLVRGF